MEDLNEKYWNDRYLESRTGWDLGAVSPPLKAYIDQISDKQQHILIPGCGNAYEAQYLADQGFENVTVIDISPQLVAQLQQRLADKGVKVLHGDFFQHTGSYHLIIEQTFFCALQKQRRADYVKHMHQLLKNEGKLVGLLFNTEFEQEGPPFGGNIAEYKALFGPYFNLNIMDPSYNSAAPRAGNELFIKLEKR